MSTKEHNSENISEFVVLAAVPLVDTNRALSAPALLKASLTKNNIKSHALDLNSQILTKIKSHQFKKLFFDFFIRQKINDSILVELSRIFEYAADQILKWNPTIVALSLFSRECQVFTTWLCAAIREKNPTIKIVIGGPGVKSTSGIPTLSYAENLKKLNLIDDFILGDGDRSLVEYVNGNFNYPGINSDNWNPIQNLNELPYSDYSDYDFFWYDEPTIPIVDSRGCVRTCEFCDVIEFWKKYQYMSATRVFEEMNYQIKKHKIYHFDFRSSISNGNMKEFTKLVKMIADYNSHRYRREQISWEGSFIIRPADKHPEDLWKLLNLNNARLFLGIESLIQRIRNGIGKSFSNEDIDFHLEMAQKYNIPTDILLISGYPTETQDDQDIINNWVKDRKHYANNSVMRIGLAKLGILPGTQLEKNAVTYGFVYDQENKKWINQSLHISDQLREENYNRLKQTILSCGFNL